METKVITYEERNKQIVEEFIKTLPLLSFTRIKKYKIRLNKMSRDFGKPFDTVTKEDLRFYLDRVNTRKDYSEWTKWDYRQLTKKFFRWLHNDEFVSWIKVGQVKTRVGVNDILIEVELEMLRKACTNIRDKALIETLYEGAFRPHEFLSLKKSSVFFDDYGAIIYVERGKTGPRRIRVLNAAPLLATWIANHPCKEKDAPLWVDLSSNTKHEGLKWLGLVKILKRLQKAAEIQKRINPYIFRHTRLTYLSKYLTEAQLCEFAGWEQGTRMPLMYVHLSGRDVDEALLRAHGLVKPKETQTAATPKRCMRCGTMCAKNEEMCSKCGMVLSLEAAMRKDKELEELREMVKKLKNDSEEFKAILRALDKSIGGQVFITKKK